MQEEIENLSRQNQNYKLILAPTLYLEHIEEPAHTEEARCYSARSKSIDDARQGVKFQAPLKKRKKDTNDKQPKYTKDDAINRSTAPTEKFLLKLKADEAD